MAKSRTQKRVPTDEAAEKEGRRRNLAALALVTARARHPYTRGLLPSKAAQIAGISSSLYSMLESGTAAVTSDSFGKLIAAHVGNPVGQVALELARARILGTQVPLPARLDDDASLSEEEAFFMGREVRRLYDLGDFRSSVRVAAAARSLFPADMRYSREWFTGDSILTRAFSELRDFERAQKLSENLLRVASDAEDPRMVVYSLQSLVATERRARGPSNFPIALRDYEEVLDRYITPGISRENTLGWAQTRNGNLREQLRVVFSALEEGRDAELERVMRSLWLRVLESAERLNGIPLYRFPTELCEARVLAYEDPDRALDLARRLAGRTRKLTFHLSLEVTRLVALQTACRHAQVRNQANVVGSFGVLLGGHSRSERLVRLRKRAVREAGYVPDELDQTDPLEKCLSRFPRFVASQSLTGT